MLRTSESKIAYNKQQNVCESLLPKTKRDYSPNLDTKIVKYNRKFWKTENYLFSKKFYSKQFISLINKDRIITKKKDLAKSFNIFLKALLKQNRHRERTQR